MGEKKVPEVTEEGQSETKSFRRSPGGRKQMRFDTRKGGDDSWR